MAGKNEEYWAEVWEKNFKLLLKYKKKYGTVNVPQNNKKKKNVPEWEYKLGYWVNNQRMFFKRGTLKPGRFERLSEEGLIFDPWNEQFEIHFQAFLDFKEEHGHPFVPQRYTEFPSLGSWTVRTRQEEKIPERIKRLNEAGFVWNTKEYAWFEKYNQLKAFKKEHGHTFVDDTEGKNKSLYRWCVKMRTAKRQGIKGTLSKEREKLLDDIGFVWEKKQYSWDLNFERLLQYKKKHGHAYVRMHNCDVPGLKSWVKWIRRNIHNLSKERIRQLKSIGFEWETEKSKKKRKQFIAEKIRNDGYLTLTETKKIFGVKRATVYRMRKKGWLKYYQIGKNVFFKKEDIIEAMKRPELSNYRNRLKKIIKIKI